MGEIVQTNMESMTEDIKEFKRSQLFEDYEINVFLKRRKDFYYKIHGVTKNLSDFQEAIEYEKFILLKIATRRKKKNISQKKQELDFIIIKRIKYYYDNALLRYSNDYKLCLSYFEFLKHYKSYHQAATHQIKNMIEKFHSKPAVFQVAAAWFMRTSRKEALKIIHRGLAKHPDNKYLYLDAIELELKEPQEREEQRFKTYMESIFKHVGDFNFIVDILKLLENYPRTIGVQNYIIDKLFEKYSSEELVWHAVAQRELNGYYYKVAGEEHSKKSTRYSIKRCIGRYQEGISKLPKNKQPALWKLYIDALIDLQKKNPNVANVIKINSLKQALEDAKKAKIKLEETHYAAWIEICSDNERLALDVLEEGTKEYPDSGLLWELFLKIYIIQDKVKEADEVFERAARALGPRGQAIWDMIIDYHLLRSSNLTVETLYVRAITEPYEEISKVFKPRYLTWVMLMRGIKEARLVYAEIATKPPYCKELHEEMARAEAMECFDPNVDNWAKCLELQCQQFGKQDVDVWIAHIQLYKDQGNFDMNEKIKKIYQEAIKNLPEVMLSDFKEKFAALDDSSNDML